MSVCREHYVNIIRNKAQRDKEAAMTEEDRKIAEWNQAYNEVARLSDRIADILSLANECKRNKIKIPEAKGSPSGYNAARKYGYDAEFIADRWRHHVGLVYRPSPMNAKYSCLAILNGGACGNIDLKVTDEDIWGEINTGDTKGERVQARQQDLLKFAREFPCFEAAFYNWLDSLEED